MPKNNKNNENHCSFCGRAESEVNMLLAGVNGFICDECSLQAAKIVGENTSPAPVVPQKQFFFFFSSYPTHVN